MLRLIAIIGFISNIIQSQSVNVPTIATLIQPAVKQLDVPTVLSAIPPTIPALPPSLASLLPDSERAKYSPSQIIPAGSPDAMQYLCPLPSHGLNTTAQLSGATFSVSQVITKVTTADFDTIAEKISFARAVQCVMNGAYAIEPVDVREFKVNPHPTGVNLTYVIHYLYPLESGSNKNSHMVEYYKELNQALSTASATGRLILTSQRNCLLGYGVQCFGVAEIDDPPMFKTAVTDPVSTAGNTKVGAFSNGASDGAVAGDNPVAGRSNSNGNGAVASPVASPTTTPGVGVNVPTIATLIQPAVKQLDVPTVLSAIPPTIPALPPSLASLLPDSERAKYSPSQIIPAGSPDAMQYLCPLPSHGLNTTAQLSGATFSVSQVITKVTTADFDTIAEKISFARAVQCVMNGAYAIEPVDVREFKVNPHPTGVNLTYVIHYLYPLESGSNKNNHMVEYYKELNQALSTASATGRLILTSQRNCLLGYGVQCFGVAEIDDPPMFKTAVTDPVSTAGNTKVGAFSNGASDGDVAGDNPVAGRSNSNGNGAVASPVASPTTTPGVGVNVPTIATLIQPAVKQLDVPTVLSAIPPTIPALPPSLASLLPDSERAKYSPSQIIPAGSPDAMQYLCPLPSHGLNTTAQLSGATFSVSQVITKVTTADFDTIAEKISFARAVQCVMNGAYAIEPVDVREFKVNPHPTGVNLTYVIHYLYPLESGSNKNSHMVEYYKELNQALSTASATGRLILTSQRNCLLGYGVQCFGVAEIDDPPMFKTAVTDPVSTAGNTKVGAFSNGASDGAVAGDNPVAGRSNSNGNGAVASPVASPTTTPGVGVNVPTIATLIQPAVKQLDVPTVLSAIPPTIPALPPSLASLLPDSERAKYSPSQIIPAGSPDAMQYLCPLPSHGLNTTAQLSGATFSVSQVITKVTTADFDTIAEKISFARAVQCVMNGAYAIEPVDVREFKVNPHPTGVNLTYVIHYLYPLESGSNKNSHMVEYYKELNQALSTASATGRLILTSQRNCLLGYGVQCFGVAEIDDPPMFKTAVTDPVSTAGNTKVGAFSNGASDGDVAGDNPVAGRSNSNGNGAVASPVASPTTTPGVGVNVPTIATLIQPAVKQLDVPTVLSAIPPTIPALPPSLASLLPDSERAKYSPSQIIPAGSPDAMQYLCPLPSHGLNTTAQLSGATFSVSQVITKVTTADFDTIAEKISFARAVQCVMNGAYAIEPVDVREFKVNPHPTGVNLTYVIHYLYPLESGSNKNSHMVEYYKELNQALSTASATGRLILTSQRNCLLGYGVQCFGVAEIDDPPMFKTAVTDPVSTAGNTKVGAFSNGASDGDVAGDNPVAGRSNSNGNGAVASPVASPTTTPGVGVNVPTIATLIQPAVKQLDVPTVLSAIPPTIPALPPSLASLLPDSERAKYSPSQIIPAGSPDAMQYLCPLPSHGLNTTAQLSGATFSVSQVITKVTTADFDTIAEKISFARAVQCVMNGAYAIEPVDVREFKVNPHPTGVNLTYVIHYLYPLESGSNKNSHMVEYYKELNQALSTASATGRLILTSQRNCLLGYGVQCFGVAEIDDPPMFKTAVTDPVSTAGNTKVGAFSNGASDGAVAGDNPVAGRSSSGSSSSSSSNSGDVTYISSSPVSTPTALISVTSIAPAIQPAVKQLDVPTVLSVLPPTIPALPPSLASLMSDSERAKYAPSQIIPAGSPDALKYLCPLISQNTTATLSSASFSVSQVISGISSTDFDTIGEKVSYVRAIQCAMNGPYAIQPVEVKSFTVSPDPNGVKLTYAIKYLYPLLSNGNTEKYKQEFFTKLSNELTKSSVNGNLILISQRNCLLGYGVECFIQAESDFPPEFVPPPATTTATTIEARSNGNAVYAEPSLASVSSPSYNIPTINTVSNGGGLFDFFTPTTPFPTIDLFGPKPVSPIFNFPTNPIFAPTTISPVFNFPSLTAPTPTSPIFNAFTPPPALTSLTIAPVFNIVTKPIGVPTISSILPPTVSKEFSKPSITSNLVPTTNELNIPTIFNILPPAITVFPPSLIAVLPPSFVAELPPSSIAPPGSPTASIYLCPLQSQTNYKPLSSASFQVTQMISGAASSDFATDSSKDSFTRAVQCSMNGQYAINPVKIKMLNVLDGRRMLNTKESLQASSVALTYSIQYDFPTDTDFLTYYNELTAILNRESSNGNLILKVQQNCLLAYGKVCLSSAKAQTPTYTAASVVSHSNSNSDSSSNMESSAPHTAKGPSGIALIGIIVGILSGALLIALVVYTTYCLRRANNNKDDYTSVKSHSMKSWTDTERGDIDVSRMKSTDGSSVTSKAYHL